MALWTCLGPEYLPCVLHCLHIHLKNGGWGNVGVYLEIAHYHCNTDNLDNILLKGANLEQVAEFLSSFVKPFPIKAVYDKYDSIRCIIVISPANVSAASLVTCEQHEVPACSVPERHSVLTRGA
jgi:hypothetical protein